MSTRLVQENLYLQRIHTVINYIRTHLTDELSLDVLANVAGFSRFHFHRVFKSIAEETLNEAVTRLRLERAVALLRATPTQTITDVAFACGFKSVAVFSRTFKNQYAINASQWDRQSPLKNSKNGQVLDGFPRYTLENLQDFDFKVELRSLPEQRLAYIRVYDSYSDFERVKDAYYRLTAWYRERGGRLEDTVLYGMSQDDPEVTPLHLCRYDWCLAVPADWQADDEVDIVTFPACQVISVRCAGDVMLEDKILHYIFRYWLPRSRYQPANLPGMEIYRRHPSELGWETFDIDCAIPIVEL